MKIFNTKEKYSEKVNFVDENNVFVGYDTDQSCCEHADYFISDKEENEDRDNQGILEGLEDYIFDTNYFKEVEPKADNYGSCLDAGRMVRFKLVANNKPDLYLHLYNSHNGYYGHGFEFGIGTEVKQSGNL
jgi:hypothetical protein